jgi:hypothetical protein
MLNATSHFLMAVRNIPGRAKIESPFLPAWQRARLTA